MAKRQLTQQQQRRIDTLQQDKQQQALRGRVVARYGKQADVEMDENTYRCQCRQHLNATVVGDYVAWQWDDEAAKTGVIVAIEARASVLSRVNRDGREKTIAANIDRMFITVAVEPLSSLNVIDRYLVLAELQQITPIIVLNKIDQVDEQGYQAIQEHLQVYRQLGYVVLCVSAAKQLAINGLQQQVSGQTSVFVGLSGVGKSSLLQALLPDETIRIGEMKEAAKIGRHTTTTSQLYHLPTGGNVIDSPGIRELAIGQYNTEQIAQGFVEFAPYLGLCKYRDCRHVDVPGCAVAAAVEQGKITEQRYLAYCGMVG